MSLDKLTVPVEEPDDNVKEDNVQDDYTCIEIETKPSGEDSGMESSEHSLMEAELLQERSEALIVMKIIRTVQKQLASLMDARILKSAEMILC